MSWQLSHTKEIGIDGHILKSYKHEYLKRNMYREEEWNHEVMVLFLIDYNIIFMLEST